MASSLSLLLKGCKVLTPKVLSPFICDDVFKNYKVKNHSPHKLLKGVTLVPGTVKLLHQ